MIFVVTGESRVLSESGGNAYLFCRYFVDVILIRALDWIQDIFGIGYFLNYC